jgi:uncharacterized membrane protein YoaK (UPF0700 family)
MSFNPIWLLLIAILLAVLSFYKYIALEFALGLFIIYIFCLGLMIEFREIKAKESLKSVIIGNVERIEKLIDGTVQKMDADIRIKERIKARKREIIEWLDKF